MTIGESLQDITSRLNNVGIATARLDSLVLLEDVLGKDRSWLLAHADQIVTEVQVQELSKMTERRAGHEPLAYIRGHSEFYGREFIVSPVTLEPRPETETIIELLKSLELPDNAVIADIGTGSGAIAITAKLEIPSTTVWATEINTDALEIAQRNADKHNVRIELLQGNLLLPLMQMDIKPHVLLCNLPYVPDSHTINQAAMQEPAIAIFGGADGLDLYRSLFHHIDASAAKPRVILTESLPFQHQSLRKLAQEYGYQQHDEADFIQLFSR